MSSSKSFPDTLSRCLLWCSAYCVAYLAPLSSVLNTVYRPITVYFWTSKCTLIIVSFHNVYLYCLASACWNLVHTADADILTRLSFLIRFGGVNRKGDKSRLSATENFEPVLSIWKCGGIDYWKQSWLVANSVDTTDKTRQSCFVRVGCVNCELGIRILSSMWKATEYINMLRLNVMRALDGIPCMCVVLTGYGRAFYVASVWTLMTWKWSFLLFFYTRQYRRLYEHRIGTCADVGYLHVWR